LVIKFEVSSSDEYLNVAGSCLCCRVCQKLLSARTKCNGFPCG